MDLIYTDTSLNDLGILKDFTYDWESGSKVKDCSFELQVPTNYRKWVKGEHVYVDGTEFGGIIDTITIDTEEKITKLNGRTWRGMLGSHILKPPSGKAYYQLSNITLRNAVNQLITLLNGSGTAVFSVPANANTPTITSYNFERYTDYYTGIMKLVASENYKLKLRKEGKKIMVYLEPITDYTNADAFTSDRFDFVLSSTTPVNHIVGLGAGQLTERYVVDRYAWPDGTIHSTAWDAEYASTKEVAIVWEDNNLSNEELVAKVESKLKEYQETDTLKIKAHNLEADLGDKFTAEEVTTGVSITQFVTNKIVTINNTDVRIQYKVGNKI